MTKKRCAALLSCFAMTANAAQPWSINDWLNPMLYPKNSRPFEKSITSWGELNWQWIYAQPLAHNPLLDATGADCAVVQSGPVWQLAPIAAPRSGTITRACVIARGKAILLNVDSVSDEWPCPDASFGPRAGQSLYDFLIADALTFNKVTELDL